MSDWVGSAVGATSQFLGQWAGAETDKRMQEKEFKHNKYMAQYAYGKDLEMWERANEYNHPIQQMSRLKSAGINPHLAYSKGTPQNVGATQLPKYQEVRANFRGRRPKIDPAAAFQLALQGKLVDAQVKNLNANTGLSSAKARTAEFQLGLERAYGEATKVANLNKLESEGKRAAALSTMENWKRQIMGENIALYESAYEAEMKLKELQTEWQEEINKRVRDGVFPNAQFGNNVLNLFLHEIQQWIKTYFGNKNK